VEPVLILSAIGITHRAGAARLRAWSWGRSGRAERIPGSRSFVGGPLVSGPRVAKGDEPARRPAWGLLYAVTAAGFAAFWWVNSDPSRPGRLAWELGLVGAIFGGVALWIRRNRAVLADQDAMVHRGDPPPIETAVEVSDGALLLPNRNWYTRGQHRMGPRGEARAFRRSPRTLGVDEAGSRSSRSPGGARMGGNCASIPDPASSSTPGGATAPSPRGARSAERPRTLSGPTTSPAGATDEQTSARVPGAQPDPLTDLPDRSVCPACENVATGFKRGRTFVCQYCGHRHEDRDP
jgi:hypothetical protein